MVSFDPEKLRGGNSKNAPKCFLTRRKMSGKRQGDIRI